MEFDALTLFRGVRESGATMSRVGKAGYEGWLGVMTVF